LSFSSDVKNELARLESNKPCCDKAELLGLLRMSGAIVIRGSDAGINFSTSNAALARRVLQFLKNYYQVKTEVVVSRSNRLRKNNHYQVQVLPDARVNMVMAEMQLLSAESDMKNPLLSRHCCKRAFLRGSFLGGGSITRPSVDYHMEMVTDNGSFAQCIAKNMNTFSLKVKITERKKDYLVYLKDSGRIVRFLNVIGAHTSMMEFENVRILKEMRNNVNRLVNCEMANLNKVIKAAVKQVVCIKYLDEHLGLGELSQGLQDTARLRLKYPEASLNELVEYSGGIGKSGLNHRLKKLQTLAEGLGLETEPEQA